jgi:outer membrane protein TolC
MERIDSKKTSPRKDRLKTLLPRLASGFLLSTVVSSWVFADVGQPAPASVSTLKEAYAQALRTSERITVSEQTVREAEALYRQTLGASFPALSFVHDTLLQDQAGGAAARSNGSFQLRKTGLSGYRELAALRAGRSQLAQRRFEQARAEQLLLGNVAGAFFGLLQAKENVRATDRLAELAKRRLTELRERVRVGRTREADALQQEFQITSLASQKEELARQVDSRANLLAFLVGRPLSDPGLSGGGIAAQAPSEEAYLARVGRRPDVRALAESVETSASFVRIARAEYLPRLDLGANAYLYRPAAQRNSDWDAFVTLGVPLWTWGARRGSVDAATAVLEQNRAVLHEAERQAALEIRNAYRDYAAARAQLGFQEHLVALARRDYEFQRRDDRRGLVTSLEVIESLNRLNSVELSLNNARLDERLAALNLEIASGATPEEVLQ